MLLVQKNSDPCRFYRRSVRKSIKIISMMSDTELITIDLDIFETTFSFKQMIETNVILNNIKLKTCGY